MSLNSSLLKFEKLLWQDGHEYIAGIDEVGRGALAGPMVVSAVILNTKRLKEYIMSVNQNEKGTLYAQINDSKKVSAKKRLVLSEFILNESTSYSVVEIPHSDIDSKGIMPCTQEAFFKAVKKLTHKPSHVLTDSYEIKLLDISSQTNIVAGDSKSISIAAASIVAKVYRDNLMIKMHQNEKYKVYGFDKHKGYGTAFHREMIKKHGLSDIHRKSFKIK